MKKYFNKLTKADVQRLRIKSVSVTSGKSVTYAFTDQNVEDAKKHLESLYSGRGYYSFVQKILLLNEIY